MIMDQWDYASSNEFLFNGKEMQDELGPDWYDYRARMYDPQTGRWHVADTPAESLFEFSPCSYTYNNPVIFIVPAGIIPDGFTSRRKRVIQ